MISIENISYLVNQRPVLNRIAAKLQRGKVHVLLGPNGAGKSTLLKILSGETKPAAGAVRFDQQDIHAMSPGQLALQRAVLTQQYAVNLPFEGQEVVMMGRYPHFDQQPGAADKQVVQEVMHSLQVSHLATRPFHTLSGGEQQRLQLGRVLAQLKAGDISKKYLLLDEPTSSMDLLHQQLCLSEVKALAAQGLTVVVVLHDLNLAAQFADHILLLHKGSLHVSGSPEEVLQAATIGAVYGIAVAVLQHEAYDHPIVLPLLAQPVGVV